MTVLTKSLVLSAPLWDSGDREWDVGGVGVARAGGGLAAGHLGLAPSLGTSFTPASPYTHSAGKFALLGLGSQAAWHSARLAAERGQQGGASGRGTEDVAGRPGHEQDPRPGARGPEGEGTPGGSRVSDGGGQAVQPGWEQASWEDAGWRKDHGSTRPPACSVSCPPQAGGCSL